MSETTSISWVILYIYKSVTSKLDRLVDTKYRHEHDLGAYQVIDTFVDVASILILYHCVRF